MNYKSVLKEMDSDLDLILEKYRYATDGPETRKEIAEEVYDCARSYLQKYLGLRAHINTLQNRDPLEPDVIIYMMINGVNEEIIIPAS